MSSKHVIIEISPSRVEAYIRRGGAGAVERLTPSENTPANGKAAAVARAGTDVGSSLARVVAELAITGGAATVLYNGAVANVSSFPLAMSASDTDTAAVLALAGLADFEVEEHPSDCVRLGRDGGGEGAQQHFLAAADREERLSELTRVVRAAGLNPEEFVPAEAVAMAQAVAAAQTGTARKGGAAVGSRASIWLGEHFTAVAAMAAGRLAFVRLTGTGLESFVEALRRPIRAKDGTAEPITLDRATARELLALTGVPTADQVIPIRGGLEGSALLPLLSPVIQRLSSEVKQSLRFGLAEAQRADVSLRLIGPGALIPGLPSIIARQCGLTLEEATGAEDAKGEVSSASHGVIAAYLEHERNVPRLLPRSIECAVAVRRARVSLVGGMLIAAGWIAYEHTENDLALGVATARLAALNNEVREGVADGALREQAIAANLASAALERRVQSTLGFMPDWPAIMTVLADAAPPEVKLTAVDLDMQASANGCSIRGYVLSDRPAEAAGLIRGLIRELETHPLIEDVRLGVTQRIQIGGKDCQEFELIVAPIAVPVAWPAESAATNPGASRSQEAGS